MTTHFKITTIVTFVVGVQLFDLMGNANLFSIIFNTNLSQHVSSTTVLAADVRLSTMSQVSANSRFIPPKKGAPVNTQGSGTR